MLAELTFRQELVKQLVGAGATALATAAFVTISGTVVANSWSKKRDERRARFDERTKLLERTARTAGTMYSLCQNTRRILRELEDDQNAGRISESAASFSRAKPISALDAAYLQFSVEGLALENELGARFGFNETLMGANAEGSDLSAIWERWHQVRDLLTVYYFNLKGKFPGDVLQRNSPDQSKRKCHSGLDLINLQTDLAAMRNAIRSKYEEATLELFRAMLRDPITTG